MINCMQRGIWCLENGLIYQLILIFSHSLSQLPFFLFCLLQIVSIRLIINFRVRWREKKKAETNRKEQMLKWPTIVEYVSFWKLVANEQWSMRRVDNQYTHSMSAIHGAAALNRSNETTKVHCLFNAIRSIGVGMTRSMFPMFAMGEFAH